MRGKAALVLCFAAVVIWTSDILDDEFHDETASHQLEAALKEEQDVPRFSSSSGFLRQLALPGNAQLAKEMVAKSGRRNVQETSVPVRVLWGGYTPLHEAAEDGDVSEVKELLAKGVEVNAKNNYGHPPLHTAAWHGHLDVVKELLAKGAEVNAKNNYGYTPLHKAAYGGHLDVVKELLSKGAEVNAKDEDVVQASVIKLAERAKKSNESKEAPKIVTDALQARCLPELAQWAVNHSYAIDDFPGDASMARSCVLQYMSFEARERLAIGSKWSYVYPGAGVAIAAVSVYMVEPLILHRSGSVDAPGHEEGHNFYRGAHLLVGKAAVKCYWPKVAFRLVEVMSIIGFSMGFAMVELWWVPWLPFVGLLFLLPGIKLYGSKELIRAPVKCIASTNTREGYMWSFLRLVLIFGAYKGVEATTGWRRREANPWDFLSLKMEMFVNPLHEGLQNKINFMWREANLAPFLDYIWHIVTLGSKNSINEMDIPWINGQVKWLAQRSALNISELGKWVLFLSLSVYAGSLLLRMLHQCCKDGDIPDINYVSYAKDLAECPTEDVPGLIEEIKQKEPHHLQVKPIGTCSLIKMLMLVALDVCLDVNTIRTLILSSNLRFACALSFVVARSTFREWNNFSGLKEAVEESYKRGMLHEQLIDLLEEEKGAEAFFSLSITSYSYVYCVQTGKQAVVQWLSILLAAYGIAEFLVQKMEFPTTEVPTTEKVHSFVIVPSEEGQKEKKGDASIGLCCISSTLTCLPRHAQRADRDLPVPYRQ